MEAFTLGVVTGTCFGLAIILPFIVVRLNDILDELKKLNRK